MESEILLSILVPTKNRQYYAKKVISQILSIPSSIIQLVVQDNSDCKSLYDDLHEQITDPRLLYNYNHQLLSFVENFSIGISHCIGKYLIIIGDDDGINPEIVDLILWASKYDIDAISPSITFTYFWPDSGIKNIDANGVLYINNFTSDGKIINPKNELKQFFKSGCNSYLNYNLSKVYHGIVKKSILDDIKNITGNYIGGLSPDIYMSIATSLFVDKLLILDYPLTIAGVCKNSGSTDSATGKHTGKLQNAPHFKGHAKYEWNDLIPPIYSVDTIWADSALAAIINLNRSEYLKLFNQKKHIFRCFRKYPSLNSDLKYFAKKANFSSFTINFIIPIKNTISIIFAFIIKCLKKVFTKHKRIIYSNVNDIASATYYCNRYLKNQKSNIQKGLTYTYLNLKSK